MGCDVHLHVEVKIDGVWHHYSNPHVPRSYRLFGKMAGVRSDEVDPIAEPRGLPDDLSLITKMDADYWKGCGHTHSWLTGDELEEVLQWNDKRIQQETGQWFSSHHTFFGYLFQNGWKLYPDECEDPRAKLEAVRAVFWFDN